MEHVDTVLNWIFVIIALGCVGYTYKYDLNLMVVFIIFMDFQIYGIVSIIRRRITINLFTLTNSIAVLGGIMMMLIGGLLFALYIFYV